MKDWLTKNAVWLGVVIAALALVPSAVDLLKPAPNPEPAAPPVVTNTGNVTATAGDGGVAAGVINGDVTVNNGYTREQYKKELHAREAALLKERRLLLDNANSRTEEQIERRIVVERELAVIEDKRANIEASYAEVLQQLEEAKATNQELAGQVPAVGHRHPHIDN